MLIVTVPKNKNKISLLTQTIISATKYIHLRMGMYVCVGIFVCMYVYVNAYFMSACEGCMQNNECIGTLLVWHICISPKIIF